MAGIKLKGEDEVIAFSEIVEEQETMVITVSDQGNLKISPIGEYPAKGRGTGGLRCQSFKKRETALATAFVIKNPIILSQGWAEVDKPNTSFRRDSAGLELEYKYIAWL
jgi:DNA gyrase subunit A